MASFTVQVLIGLTSAMYLWLIAAGLALIFGVVRVLNAAHASLYMLGGYMGFTFYHLLGMDYGLALILSMISVGFIALFMERLFMRPLYGQPLEFQLLLTFAFVLVFDNVARMAWGTAFTLIKMPAGLAGNIYILDRPFPIHGLFTIGVGMALYFIMWFVISKTWWGRTIRAAASDREMASAVGVNVPALFSSTFMVAGMLAAFGGVLNLPMQVINASLGGEFIVPAFVVAVIGTLGNITGAFVAALIIGVVGAICTLYLPLYDVFIPYVIMAVVLIIRPGGLFGKPT